jgi:hypothetical protein
LQALNRVHRLIGSRVEADVDGSIGNLECNTVVLQQPFFCEIELCHDLEMLAQQSVEFDIGFDLDFVDHAEQASALASTDPPFLRVNQKLPKPVFAPVSSQGAYRMSMGVRLHIFQLKEVLQISKSRVIADPRA